MNLRQIIRQYQYLSTLTPLVDDLKRFEKEILLKAKNAGLKAQNGCIPCKAAEAAYMDVLGPKEEVTET